MLKIEFDTTNAAFEGCEREETARILRAIANKIETGASFSVVMDANGNKIGRYDFSEDQEEQAN